MSDELALADALRAGDRDLQAEILARHGVDRAAVIDTTNGRGQRLVTVAYGVDVRALR